MKKSDRKQLEELLADLCQAQTNLTRELDRCNDASEVSFARRDEAFDKAIKFVESLVEAYG